MKNETEKYQQNRHVFEMKIVRFFLEKVQPSILFFIERKFSEFFIVKFVRLEIVKIIEDHRFVRDNIALTIFVRHNQCTNVERIVS